MLTQLRKVLITAPWLAGIVGALLPLIWLWTNYPITLHSRSTTGKVVTATVSQSDRLVPTGSQGVAYVVCYDMNVKFEFELDRVRHRGNHLLESCDLLSLRQRADQLKGRNVTVIYNENHPENAFLVELISKVKLKLAVALSVALLILCTLIFGQSSGRFSSNALNISISQIPRRFLLAGFALVLFYVWLLSI